MTEHLALTPVTVVLNAASGALLDRTDAAAELEALLREAGFAPRLIPTELGSLPERIAEACASPGKAVIVAGGDGTIACAAQQASAAGVTLGILPFGTMNVLAKDLGIPTGDLKGAIAVLRDGAIREIDAAEVNGQLYFCASMLGLPARLARHREAGRGSGLAVSLWYRFARAALRAFARYGAPHAQLRIDGRDVRTHVAAITITPNLLNDTTGRMLGRDRLDAGTLGLYTIRHLTLGSVVALVIRTIFRSPRNNSELRGEAAREVVVARLGRRSGKAIRVMNDGEVTLLAPPLVYRIVPRALRVIAPAGMAA